MVKAEITVAVAMVSALGYAFALRWAAFYAANQIDTDPEYIAVLYAIPIVSSIISGPAWLPPTRISSAIRSASSRVKTR